jgi:hypothetical protein
VVRGRGALRTDLVVAFCLISVQLRLMEGFVIFFFFFFFFLFFLLMALAIVVFGASAHHLVMKV